MKISFDGARKHSNHIPDIVIRHLGSQPYEPCFEAMKAFTKKRDDTTQDELWCLEHEPVFTQGRAGKAEHILDLGSIPLVQIDRGGQVTYHGPGQLTVYLLLDIQRRSLGVRDLVTAMEVAIVDTLLCFGVEAAARADAPGVYVGEAKIASLGLRISRGCSYHGLSLNVAMDKEPWERINPCGLGVPITQVADELAEFPKEAVISKQLIENLLRELRYNSPSFVDDFPKGIQS